MRRIARGPDNGAQSRSGRCDNRGGTTAARRRLPARKAATDRGLTGDKVPGFDPAAAPLGTDAETGGAPPLAAADPPLPERRRADPAGLGRRSERHRTRPYRMQDRMIWPVIAAMLVAIAIIVAIIFVV